MRPGWNPLAGYRRAGQGFGDVAFQVTKQLDWLSFSATDAVDNAVRFLNGVPKSGLTKTTGSVWPVPWNNAEVTEMFYFAGGGGSGGTGYDFSVRVQGVNEHTMSVPVGTTQQNEVCSVFPGIGERINLFQDGTGVVDHATNMHVSLRIERDPP